MDDANTINAVRLTDKRRFAKVGDLFRLSPHSGVFLWGRFIKKAEFFRQEFASPLVYIYDVVSCERPEPQLLNPSNLIIGPVVVNNLGWVRGYWEIMESLPLLPSDIRDSHLFVRYRGTRSSADYDLVDEKGRVVIDPAVDPRSLSQAAYSNFNNIDWRVRDI